MGEVAKQGIRYSIIGFLGSLIGILSTFFVFHQDEEFYGKVRFIIPTAELLLPIIVFGLSFSNVKFFLITKEKNRHFDMLSWSLVLVSSIYLIFCLVFFACGHFFPEVKALQVWKMKGIILPLLLIMAWSAVLNKFLTNYKKIAVSNIFENIFPKLATLLSFCLFHYFGMTEKFSLMVIVGIFFLGLSGYFFYLNKVEKIKLSFSKDIFIENQLWKQIAVFSLFGFLGNIGNYVAFRIDNYMITEYISYSANGVYSIILSMLSIISIPQMGVQNISAPLINEAFARDDMKSLDRLHKDTSLQLFFSGVFIFICIVAGYTYLAHFLKIGNELLHYRYILFIIGANVLFDLATGFNSHIISFSKYFRFTIMVMLILSILTIILNWIFIHYTDWGILGVATATCISLVIYNVVKLIFNYQKFRVQPFSWPMLKIIVFAGIALAILSWIPPNDNTAVNLITRPIFCGVLFLIMNQISPAVPLKHWLKHIPLLGKFFKN